MWVSTVTRGEPHKAAAYPPMTTKRTPSSVRVPSARRGSKARLVTGGSQGRRQVAPAGRRGLGSLGIAQVKQTADQTAVNADAALGLDLQAAAAKVQKLGQRVDPRDNPAGFDPSHRGLRHVSQPGQLTLGQTSAAACVSESSGRSHDVIYDIKPWWARRWPIVSRAPPAAEVPPPGPPPGPPADTRNRPTWPACRWSRERSRAPFRPRGSPAGDEMSRRWRPCRCVP